MKKLISIVSCMLVVITMFGFSVSAAIVPSPDVEPLWDNIAMVNSTLAFAGTNNTDGGAEIIVTGKTGTTKIEITGTVYKLVGSDTVYVTGDSKSVNWRNASMALPFTGEHGYTYQAIFDIVVYKGTSAESYQKVLTEYCE